jgi:hypothetical protein
MSAVSIAVNIELPMKSVKYTESRSIRHKLSFADKTRQYTSKLGSLLRKICKEQDFIDAKDSYWKQFWLKRFNKYNSDYMRKEYNKFVNDRKELTVSTHDLFSTAWINNFKEVIQKRVKVDKSYLQAQHLRKIQDSIEKRCNIIQFDIPKWLQSTQNAFKEHIVIDRAVVSSTDEDIRLVLKLDTVKNHAKDTFEGIF